MEFDEEGWAIPGTYALSTVMLGGSYADGRPFAIVDSAVCDVCGKWASEVWTAARTTTANDSLMDVRISRRVHTVVYACPEHADDVADALVDEFGSASNAYDPDELAEKVSKTARASRVDGRVDR